MVGELVEAADRWLVPMAGLTVTQCRLDYSFTLVLAGDDEGSFYVAIEEPFSVSMPGSSDEVALDPEGEPVQMAPRKQKPGTQCCVPWTWARSMEAAATSDRAVSEGVRHGRPQARLTRPADHRAADDASAK